MSSLSVFLSLSDACSVQGPYPTLSGVFLSHKGRGSTHTALLNRVESNTFHLINSSPLTDHLQSLNHLCSVAFLLSSTVIFVVTAVLNLLTACLPASCGLTAQDFLLTLIPVLSTLLLQELKPYLHSFIPFTGKLWNSLSHSVFPPYYNLNSLRKEFRGTSTTKLIFCLNTHSYQLLGVALVGFFFLLFFVFALGQPPLM